MSNIDGELLVFDQHDGPSVQLRVFGDEFYARYETTSGYTVVYDTDLGHYCFATLRNGAFTSTGIRSSLNPPADVPRHLKESTTVRNRKFEHRHAQIRPPEPIDPEQPQLTFGSNNGLLPGRRVGTNGAVRGLTIIVEFDDIRTQVTADDVEPMLNDMDYDRHGNFCSVRRYYDLMSDGQLDYTNDVVGPVRLSRRRSYYINNLLVHEALNLAIEHHGVDLANYDSSNAGIVDALSILYAGRTQYSGDLWPHNHVTHYQRGGVRTHYYTIQSVGRQAADLSIGTFVHESGHMLCRWPDLYDYGRRDGDSEKSSGLGVYCLMSSGNHLNRGKTPSAVCAYLRNLAGWCQEVSLNTQGDVTATHGDYARCLRYDTTAPNEYFLVENRTRIGLDQFLPDTGLAIYHCDTEGSNELQDGTAAEHYQCALLQADGSFDLEHHNNNGDEHDLYPEQAGLVLDRNTVPNSRNWHGADSGFVVSDISAPGEAIQFRVGQSAVNSVFVESRPDMLIPDAAQDNPGIESAMTVATTGELLAIRVQIDITHTYRGDLNIDLISPSGTRVTLHTRRQDPLENLHLDLSRESTDVLDAFIDEPIEGDWTLHVRDTWEDDVGRLDYWSLTLDYEPASQPVVAVSETTEPIPDNDPAGITSELTVDGQGSVRSISVEVLVTHSYRGDLQVELESPNGTRARLKNRSGDGNPHLNAVYDTDNTETLEALIGEESGGVWRLHLSDLAFWDQGSLRRWGITIER